MVSNFHLPPTGFGPGSQPVEDGLELDYLALPSGMRTYAPHLPEVEDITGLDAALAVLRAMADACETAARTGQRTEIDLRALDRGNRLLVAETLGQGEVAMKLRGIPALAVQESVFAGVWVLAGAGVDRVEIGPAPQAALTRAFLPHRPALLTLARRGADVVNAPALLAELMDRSARWQPGTPTHAVNLTLLPHTEDDLLWLDAALGEGSVTILSRGYGNCRITATALAHVWRVQFYNSMDALILDTFEVTEIPEVALAAPEDLSDSGLRILNVLEAIR
jgi:hydrogenase-1 operon protein HyaF